MSLRKSPTRTPAFLEANRRNAQKSTGPYTRRGKAQSCLNRLKTGERSRVYRQLWYGLLHAPPCAVGRTARALLSREQAAHPVFAELVDLSVGRKAWWPGTNADSASWWQRSKRRGRPARTSLSRRPRRKKLGKNSWNSKNTSSVNGQRREGAKKTKRLFLRAGERAK